MILALYRLLSPMAAALLPLFARFSPKLAATLRWREESGQARGIAPKSRPRWWVHAASAGELEQARPLLSEIRKRQPNSAILMTLSSASARSAASDLPEADRVLPMPVDTPRAMATLMEDFTPDHILVVKWDLWPNMVMEARRRNIPVSLAGAVLAPDSGRSRWPGRLLYRPLHRMIAGVAAASERDAESFRRLDVADDKLIVSGDTRFDRVIARREEERDHLLASAVFPRETCLVAGSTWPREEKMILEVFPRILADHPQARILLAPHEPEPSNLARLEDEVSRLGIPSARLSTLDDFPSGTLVFADVLGQLAELYRLGSLAFVGGGFGDGVHSVLEPAAHGLPVLMGPRIDRAVEAGELTEAGGAWIIRSADELEFAWRRHLDDASERESSTQRARDYIESGAGAAERSLNFLEKIEN